MAERWLLSPYGEAWIGQHEGGSLHTHSPPQTLCCYRMDHRELCMGWIGIQCYDSYYDSEWDGLGYSVVTHTMTLNGMDWDTLLWFILWLWMGYSVVTHTMTAFTIWSNSEYCVFKQLLHSKWSTLKCENKMCHPISSVLWNSRCALPCGVSTEAHAEVNGSDDESQQKHEVEQHRGAVGADHLLCWNTTSQDTTLKRGRREKQ